MAPVPMAGISDRYADFSLAGLEASVAVLRRDYEVDSAKLRFKIAQNQAMKEKLDEPLLHWSPVALKLPSSRRSFSFSVSFCQFLLSFLFLCGNIATSLMSYDQIGRAHV